MHRVRPQRSEGVLWHLHPTADDGATRPGKDADLRGAKEGLRLGKLTGVDCKPGKSVIFFPAERRQQWLKIRLRPRAPTLRVASNMMSAADRKICGFWPRVSRDNRQIESRLRKPSYPSKLLCGFPGPR
jgi:hypothetical protein